MNKDFTEEKIKKLADLLMIGLTEEETKMVLEEFETIDNNINKINGIESIEKVKPMTHTLDNFEFNLREDIVEESVPINELLQNCKFTDEDCVEVPKVVG